MNRFAPLTLAIGLLIAADKQPEAAPKELGKLQGTWKVVAVEEDGKRLPGGKTQGWTLTVKGDRYTFRAGKESAAGTYRLDPSTEPRAIDAVCTAGADKGKVLKGIYRLDGDTLILCFDAPGKAQRPRSFSSRSGGGRRLYVLTRGK